MKKKLHVHFASDNWNLVLKMMIGIRTCILNVYKNLNELKNKVLTIDHEVDFDMVSTYNII